MKKCDQFQDLILTDFIDGQLGRNDAVKVEEHLLDCAECRAFLKEVKSNALLPLQQSAPQPVPAELWRSIKENIELEAERSNPWAAFVEGLKGWMVLPRMIPVLASFAVMFLVGSVSLNNVHMQQIKDKDQGEYLVAMLTPGSTTSPASTETNDLGTPIEHYFL